MFDFLKGVLGHGPTSDRPQYRRLMVSDTHIGHPLVDVEAFCAFIDGCDFTELYLLGDIFDDGLKKHFPSVYRGEDVAVARRVLAERLAEDGVGCIRLSGNHDEKPEEDGGFPVKNQPYVLDTETLLTHGHHEEILWRAGDAMNRLRRGLKRPPVGRPGLRTEPWRTRAAGLMGVYRRLAAHKARLPGLHTVVHGHLHLPGIQTVRGVQLVCLPDWIDHRGGAVVEFMDGRRALIDQTYTVLRELRAAPAAAGTE